MSHRNSISLVAEVAGKAAITGTDASDWGTGQAVFIDGGLEESRLQFTSAEKRRPINWRELLGIVRVFEWYGERLSGMTVLVETDNMAAKGATCKMSSSSADMAELLRRLLDAAHLHNINVKCIHTPGEKLFRPDQSSRGDPIEEPRVRMTISEFRAASMRAGGFSEFIGGERRHATELGERDCMAGGKGIADSATAGIWAHPTYSTVGSTLRMICSRMAAETGVTGVVLVPEAREAGWWGMTRHFQTLGRWGVSSAHTEACMAGKWRGIASRRACIALAFPRAAGALPRKILHPGNSDQKGRYQHDDEGVLAGTLPVLQGSLAYQPGRVAGTRGSLFLSAKRMATTSTERQSWQ